MEKIWVRVGYGSDYCDCPGLTEAIEYLADSQAFGPFGRVKYGLICPTYDGNNYISIYWGDADAQPTRELTETEYGLIEWLLDPTKE